MAEMERKLRKQVWTTNSYLMRVSLEWTLTIKVTADCNSTRAFMPEDKLTSVGGTIPAKLSGLNKNQPGNIHD